MAQEEFITDGTGNDNLSEESRYATESARAVLEYGRKQLAGKRIVGKAFLENNASIRVLEKIGMRFEGYEPYSGGTVAVYVG